MKRRIVGAAKATVNRTLALALTVTVASAFSQRASRWAEGRVASRTDGWDGPTS